MHGSEGTEVSSLSLRGCLARKGVWHKYGASATNELRMYHCNADIDSCLMATGSVCGSVVLRLGHVMRVAVAEEEYMKICDERSTCFICALTSPVPSQLLCSQVAFAVPRE